MTYSTPLKQNVNVMAFVYLININTYHRFCFYFFVFVQTGVIPETLGESCGVYVGIGMMDYSVQLMDVSIVNPYTLTGIAHSSVANRISYAFDLRGPSTAVDTACAASFTALHMACRALWDKECSIAVAGGCNNLLLPEITSGFSALGVLSPVGKCCPFSDSAEGYVRSEGWGAFILKPLDEALANNDHVYAVIRASAIAANGFSKSITMPSAEAQEMMMRTLYDRFNIPSSTIQYVEAHGTGTPVGDPIEATAIGNFFGPERETPLKIGSVKSNFGHCECAAGIASAIKCALMLHKKKLVPTINFEGFNHRVDDKALNIQVQTEIEEFAEDEDKGPYTVGLNSFGFVGALAHMVFQEAPTQAEKPREKCGWSFEKDNKSKGNSIIIPLSAKTPESLKELASAWESFEFNKDALSVASWQATRRDHHTYRMTVLANSAESFRESVKSFSEDVGVDSVVVGTASQQKPKICFVFPGQGQHWVDMGRNLFATEPIFRDHVLKCDEIFRELSGWSVIEAWGLFGDFDAFDPPSPDNSPEAAMKNFEVSQPAILYLQVGLYHLWKHWGVEPDAVVGHSLGEVAAAYVCGGLTLREAVAVIYHRSHEQGKLLGTGRMAAVKANVAQAKEICQRHKDVYIAAVNSPGDVTLAGNSEEIAKVVAEHPGKAKQLRVLCAFHTPEMDPVEGPFKQAMEGVITPEPRKRQVPFYSTVKGHLYHDSFPTQYWWDNIRSGVLFQPAVEEVLQDINIDIVLEVSSAATLNANVKQIIRTFDPNLRISTINTGLRGKDDLHSIQRALGSFYVAGVDVNWSNITKNAADWAPTPTYQWQHHQSFYLETEDQKKQRLGLDDRSFKGQNGKVNMPFFPYLADYVLDKRIVFPAAGHVECMTQMSFSDNEIPCMKDFNFTEVLTWPEDTTSKKGVLHLEIKKDGECVEVKCENNAYSNASVDQKPSLDRAPEKAALPVEKIVERCDHEIQKEEFYDRMQKIGFSYGQAFQVVEKAFIGDGESVAYLSPITDAYQRISIPHLDATFQLALASVGPSTSMYLPVHIDSLRLIKPSLPRGETLFVYTSIVDCNSNILTADITMASECGEILAEVTGFRAQNFHGGHSDIDIDTCIYSTQWQPTSACTVPPSVISEVYEENHLSKMHKDEMDAIRRAEEVQDDFEGVCASYIRNGLEKIPEEQRWKGENYRKYINRYNEVANFTSVKNIPYKDIPDVIDRIQKHCPEFDAEIYLAKTLGEALPDILKDPQLAIQLMFSPEGVGRYFYDSLTTRIHYKAVAEAVNKAVMEGLKHKRVVRVLELGARIGGMTRFIVDPLKELGMSDRLEYVFADENSRFYTHSQANLAEYPFIKYKVLSFEKEISEQGFVPGSFDVVICLDTLHGSVDVTRSTGYIADLLNPDGLMFIVEGTNTHFIAELCFGTLNICCVYDDFRKNRCWLDAPGWANVMRKIGLLDVTTASTANEFCHSVIVGRKGTATTGLTLQDNENQNVIIQPSKLVVVQEINNKIENKFEEDIQLAYKGDVDIRSFSQAKEYEHLFSDHVSSPIDVMYIYSDADSKLHALLQLLQAVERYPESVKRVLILTKGSNKEPSLANGSLAIGLARAVSNQVPSVPIYSIDVDASFCLKKNIQELMTLMKESSKPEQELTIRNGVRLVPRVVHQEVHVSRAISTKWRVEQVPAQRGSNGSIDDLSFHDIGNMEIPPGHVKILVRAVPLNSKDVMMPMVEESELHPSFGTECAGVVVELGTGVENLKVGDEVIAFSKKCLSSHVIADVKLTALKPRNLDWTESASIGLAFVTAYLSLVQRAHLQQGETVLIHSASGGVGLAAIKIAKMLGANIICTAGTEEKRNYLRGIDGVELVSDSTSSEFRDDVIAFTEGRGVDVVLNSLPGKLLSTSMSVLAPCGRFCEIGDQDILQSANLSMNALLENKSFILCQLDIMMRQDPRFVQHLMKQVVNLFENNKLTPVPTTVYPMEKVREAFHFMATGSHIGKVVFNVTNGFSPDELKPAVQKFSSNATYIVTGGHGGIGQALSRWLCDNGARHIVLVSSNEATTAAARRAIKYMRSKGVSVYNTQVNLVDAKSISNMLTNLRNDTMVPPIKGVFHLAEITEEENFADITQEDADRILGTKATGAHHLHTLTKEDGLDVFFLLSSIDTVWGNPSLPINSAASNYLDTLAKQRHAEGLPALSVQLAPVKGAGYVDDTDLKGNLQIYVEEFLDVLGRLLEQKELAVVCLANQVSKHETFTSLDLMYTAKNKFHQSPMLHSDYTVTKQ